MLVSLDIQVIGIYIFFLHVTYFFTMHLPTAEETGYQIRILQNYYILVINYSIFICESTDKSNFMKFQAYETYLPNRFIDTSLWVVLVFVGNDRLISGLTQRIKTKPSL